MDIITPSPILPPAPLVITGYSQLTVTGSAANLSAAPAKTVFAYLMPEAGNLRWRADGVADPTADAGCPMWATGFYPVAVSLFTTMRVIRMTGSASCLLNIVWFGAV